MTDRRSPAALLKGEDGNMAVSVVFIIFTTLFMSIVVGSLLTAMGNATQSRNASTAAQGVSAVASAYMEKASAGTAPADGELCAGNHCGTVAASADGTQVTVKVTVGESTRTRTVPIPTAAGTMITGFDKDGHAVWGTRPAATPKDQQ